MMDTTNSFANSGVSLKCKPRIHFKVSGSSSSMSVVKKSTKDTKTAPESDGSSNSEDSNTSESENGMKALPRTSNHSLRSSQHSLRSSSSHSRKRSNLKKAVRAPAPEADSFDLSDSEEYGDIMKDYCYNENNVLVPRIKLGTSTHSTNNGERDDDDELSVGSSHSARERLRRGGRRPGKNKNGADEGSENTLDSSSSSKKKAQRRKGNYSFWDQDTDSSESENEILGLSPSKSDARNSMTKPPSSPTQHRFSMIAARKNSAGNVSRESSAGSMSRESSSVGSSDYFTAQEGPPSPRRGVSRNDSGWHTGGSFDSDDEEDFVKGPPTKVNNFSKLSQAALRMSRTESAGSGSTSSAFSFTKTNAKMENFSTGRDPEEEDDSNHSSASKTTSSYVSTGGWSTGKDSSSSEDEGNKRRPVATKKSASKTSKKDSKNKNKTSSAETLDPFAEFDNPKDGSRSMKVSGHSTESKFSFISAGSMDSGSTFSPEDAGISPVSCSVSSRRLNGNDLKDTSESSKLEVFAEENNGSFVFDLSGMTLDADAIFTDDPPTVSNHDGEGVEALLSASAHAKAAALVASEEEDEKARRKAAKKAKKESSKKAGEGKKDKSKDHKKDKSDKDKSKSSSKHKKDKLKDREHVLDKEKSKHKSKKDKVKDSSELVADKTAKSKKKKSSDETSVSAESKKEEKEKKKESKVMTANEKLLEKRRAERAARLEKAKERIKQQEADKKEEEATQKKMKALERKRTVVSTGSEFDRRERAYQWYTRCGMPTKEKLKERLHRVKECDVSDEDLDLLPWMTGDRMVNVAKMMKILRER